MIDIQKVREAFNANPTAKAVANVFYTRATAENGRNMRNGHTNLRRFRLQYLQHMADFNAADYVQLWRNLSTLGLGKLEEGKTLRETDFQLDFTLRSVALALFDQAKDHKDLVPQPRKAKRPVGRPPGRKNKPKAPAIPVQAAKPIPAPFVKPVAERVVSSVTLLRIKGANGREFAIETNNAEALQVALTKLLA